MLIYVSVLVFAVSLLQCNHKITTALKPVKVRFGEPESCRENIAAPIIYLSESILTCLLIRFVIESHVLIKLTWIQTLGFHPKTKPRWNVHTVAWKLKLKSICGCVGKLSWKSYLIHALLQYLLQQFYSILNVSCNIQ